MIKTVLVGVGPIGQQIARYTADRDFIKITAAIDPDPQKYGKKLSEISHDIFLDLVVSENLSSALSGKEADVAIIATVSDLERLKDQVREIAEKGLSIVSTCEELTHPWNTKPSTAKEIDEICEANGVACLGTGVNPGFLMDYLPAVYTSVCQEVDKVTVERFQDATNRRKPFRDKIGAGLSPAEFEQKQNSLSHVGLPESAYMIADTLGWKFDRVEETLEPVISPRDFSTAGVSEGEVCGLEQIVKAYHQNKELVKLVFRATVGEENPRDRIQIDGKPEFVSVIEGGINGDIATSAIVINAVRSVVRLEPGLRTMLDIPVASYIS